MAVPGNTRRSLTFGVVLVVLIQVHDVRTDFGLPTGLPNGFAMLRSAKGILGVLEGLDRSFQKLKFEGQTERMVNATQILSEVTQNVTGMGKQMATSMVRAISDKSTPSNEVFANLQETYDEMDRYLASNVTEAMEDLNNTVGEIQTSQLQGALSQVHGAFSDMMNVTSDISSAIAKILEASEGNQISKAIVSANVPSALTASLNKALGSTKDQLTMLTRTVESMLRELGQANAYLAKFNQTKQVVEKNLYGLQQNMIAINANERDLAVKRYLIIRNGIVADLSGAVKKLEVFNSNRTLLALYDQHSEEYTKIYYYLYNRNESDINNISNAYDTISGNLERILIEVTDNVGINSLSIARRLSDMLIDRSDKGATCYNKYSNLLLNTYPTFQNNVINCITREKNRIVRVGEVIDRMLQLVTATSQDFSVNVASCSALQDFAKSEYVYMQADACLNTNLNEMSNFSAIVGAQFDVVNQMTVIEVAASQYRLNNCIYSRQNEAIANADVLSSDIDRCLADQQGRGDGSEYSSYEITTEAGTECPDYEEYLLEVEANTNYTSSSEILL